VLYFLQVRSAKRTPEAAVRIAADFLADGHDAGAVLRGVTPAQVRQIQRPGFDEEELAAARAGGRLLTTGIGACPGQVGGLLMLDPDRAVAAAQNGGDVVLARARHQPGRPARDDRRPAASSPRRAAPPAMPPSSRGRWARRASSARGRWPSTQPPAP
jgi:hypothetical protein